MIDAQRVPPSAWRTSQSSQSVRSPSASKSHTDRSARPTRRWISTVRPSGLPRETARCVRSPVEAGSIEYSAVIQPRPLLYSQRGTPSSTVAVQSTSVLPCAVEDRAVRLLEEVGPDLERAELVRPPAVRSHVLGPSAPARNVRHHAAAASSAETSTCSAASSGSCRNRRPISRKTSGSPVVRNR